MDDKDEETDYSKLKNDLLNKNWLENSDEEDNEVTGSENYMDANEMNSFLAEATNGVFEAIERSEENNQETSLESEEKTPVKKQASVSADKAISASASTSASMLMSRFDVRASSSDSNISLTRDCSVRIEKIDPLSLSNIKLSKESKSVLQSPSLIEDRRISNLCNLDKILQTPVRSTQISNAQKTTNVKLSPKSEVKQKKDEDSDTTSDEETTNDTDEQVDENVAMDFGGPNQNDFSDQRSESIDDARSRSDNSESSDEQSETTDSTATESTKRGLRPRKSGLKKEPLSAKKTNQIRIKLPGDGLLKSSEDESELDEKENKSLRNKNLLIKGYHITGII
jgi:hypothetical protein